MPPLKSYPYEVLATCQRCKLMLSLVLESDGTLEADRTITSLGGGRYRHQCGGDVKVYRWKE